MQAVWNCHEYRGTGRNDHSEVTGIAPGRSIIKQPPPSETLQGSWEHFPHQADIGVRGIGPTKEAAFEQAGLALTAVITEPKSVAPTQAVSITCEAPDDEVLLVDWLNALVYEMPTRKMLFSRFAVRFNDRSLHATAWGGNRSKWCDINRPSR